MINQNRKLIFKASLLFALLQVILLHAGEGKPTIIRQELMINSNIEQAWEVLGPQFADAYKWASTVNTSRGQGKKIQGIFSERICETSMGTLHEKILRYVPGEHILSYSFEGMPKMIRSAKNTWILTPTDDGRTKLTMTMEIRIGGFMGTIMKPFMKGKMKNMMKRTVQEFKYYVETGGPHPRKVKANNRYHKKQGIK